MTNYHEWTGEQLADYFCSLDIEIPKRKPTKYDDMTGTELADYFCGPIKQVEDKRNDEIRINQESSDSIGEGSKRITARRTER